MKAIPPITIIAGILISGCASKAPLVVVDPVYVQVDSLPPEPILESIPLVVPVGVDTSFALLVDSLSVVSFVSFQNQDEAAERRNHGRWLLDEATASWLDAQMSELSDSASVASLHRSQKRFFDDAQSELEVALVENPFDAQSKLLLAQLFRIRAVRPGESEYLYKAINNLKKITDGEKGDPAFFGELGAATFEAQEWTDAEKAYAEAVRVLRFVATLTPESPMSVSDSLSMYHYIFSQGEAVTRQHRAIDALVIFESARVYAQSEKQIDRIDYLVSYIDWDGGNIAASEMRDSLRQTSAQSDLNSQFSGYLELSGFVQTRAARDETEWRLALLDSRRGNPDDSLVRMGGLYRRNIGSNDTPDSLLIRIIEDYGVISYNRATEHERLTDRRTALAYFMQAGEIPWSQQANSTLQVVRLIQNNTLEAIHFAKIGLNLSPDKEVENALLDWLVMLCGRAGLMNEAIEYHRRRVANVL